MYEKQELIKKEMKKLCKNIRDTRLQNGDTDYLYCCDPVEFPKAVMAVSQMRLNTGSINCGSKEALRDSIFDSEAFKEFVTQNNIKECIKEKTSFNTYIIRIRY